MPSLPAIALGFFLLFAGAFVFLVGFGNWADKRLLENTVVSKCRSVALGPVAICGKVAGEGAIESYVAHIRSFISQIVIEAYVRTGKSSSWKVVHKREFRMPFYVEDSTGKVLVDPEKAVLFVAEDVRYSTENDESVWAPGSSDRMYDGTNSGFLESYLDEYCLTRGISTGNPLRFKESNLCPGDPIYIYGVASDAKQNDGTETTVIRKTFWRTPYILEGNKTEMIRKLALRKFMWLVAGVALVVTSAALITAASAAEQGSRIQFNTPDVYGAAIWASLAMAGLGLILYGSIIYNGLVSLRNEVDRAFSNVDVLLKQRFDLIPNLVSVCRAYMEHESSIMQAVAEARGQWSAAQNRNDKLQAASSSGVQLRQLFARSESYPRLRANENFLELQKSLSEIEEQIADRREFYNAAVSEMNSRCQSIPDRWIATLFGFRQQPFFKAKEQVHSAPAV